MSKPENMGQYNVKFVLDGDKISIEVHCEDKYKARIVFEHIKDGFERNGTLTLSATNGIT
jgi:hypothetical protein